jgi:nicotinamidase-related amidase
MGIFTERSALVIADMIYDFVDPGGKLYVPGIEEIVPDIAALIAEARGSGVPVIFVNDAHDPDDKEFQQWGEHAVAGSRGDRVVDELAPAEGDYVLEKKRYSVFYNTKLDELLGKLGVDHLVITGTVTNICVLVSSIEGLMRGYEVTVPRNAVKALNEEDGNWALDQIERVFGGKVV